MRCFHYTGGGIYKSSIDKIRDYMEQDIKQNTIEETDKRYLKLSGGELKADSITTPLTLICTNN